ncbi:HNH endonuclease [Halarchaeum salinum]
MEYSFGMGEAGELGSTKEISGSLSTWWLMSNGYPPDWNRRRKKVYQRAGYTCQNCGQRGGPKGNAELHAHHIVPKSKGGSHSLSNLKCLCKRCHNAIHGNRRAPIQQSRGIRITKKYDEKCVEEYPVAVREDLEVYNSIISLFSDLEGVINKVGRQEKSRSPMTSVEKTDIERDGVKRQIELIRDQASSIKEDYSNIEGKSSNKTHLIKQVLEYIDMLDDQVNNLLSDSYASEGRIKRNREERNELFKQKIWTNTDDILGSIKREANQVRRRAKGPVGEDSTKIGDLLRGENTFIQTCPFCESDNMGRPFENLIRCQSCESEWVLEEGSWTNINGPPWAKGQSLSGPYWTHMSNNEVEIKYLQEIESKVGNSTPILGILVLVGYILTISVSIMQGAEIGEVMPIILIGGVVATIILISLFTILSKIALWWVPSENVAES